MSTELKTVTNWYDSRDNLSALIRYLVDTDEIRPEDIYYLVQKPWKYDAEWDAYQVAHAAECAEDAKRFVIPSITLTGGK